MKNTNAKVEFLFLGRGVQAANKNQKTSAQVEEQIDLLNKSGIPLKICQVSMAAEGLTGDDIFPGISMVFGAVETNAKIDEGYAPITF